MSAPETLPPSEGRRIARNSAVLGAGEIAGLLLGFATNLLTVRLLGQEGYGLLIGAQRFVGLFLVVVQFGLHPLLVRGIAARRGDPGAMLGTVLAMRGGLALVFAAAVWLGAEASGYLTLHRYVLIAFVAIELLGVGVESWVAVVEGLERMGRSALVSLAAAVVRFTGVAAVVLGGGELPAVLAVFAASRAVQLVCAVLLARGAAPALRLRVDLASIRPIVAEASLFVVVGFAYRALVSIDVVLLTRLAGEAQAGLYGAALVFLEPMMIVPGLVQRALLPAFSRLEAAGSGGDVARDTLQVLGLALIPGAVGLSLLSGQAMALYGSDGLSDATVVLERLAWALVFAGPMTVAAAHLTGAGRLRTLIGCYAVTLPVQVLLDFALIPQFGAGGAAGATVAGHGLLATTLLLASRRLGAGLPVAAYARYALSAAAMAGVVYGTRQLLLPIPVLLGAAVYVAGLAILLPRDGLEYRLLRELREARKRS